MTTIPQKTRVLVIGGGPAGSTAAGLLALQGFDVTLFEQSKFPRYHIGESLLPTILPIMDLLGVRDKLENYGFQRKHGAYLEWGSETWALDFGELSGSHTHAFQVPRAEFDQMLLQHARELGVHVFENVEAREISFEGERPVKVTWQQKSGNGCQHKPGRN